MKSDKIVELLTLIKKLPEKEQWKILLALLESITDEEYATMKHEKLSTKKKPHAGSTLESFGLARNTSGDQKKPHLSIQPSI